ncbi:MAG TPA: protein translocase subunit SecF [Gemmatimonadaceae bacterium]|nr:protein translocase subunit SecF [Gemmatimonadaceae bacterium]
MLRILHDTKIDFIKRWKTAALVLLIFILPAIVLIPMQGFKYSIEFTGGTLMHLKFRQTPDVGQVRQSLSDIGITGVEISTFGSPNELVIRAQEEAAVAEQASGASRIAARITDVLRQRFGRESFSVERVEAVGPKVGAELRQQAAIALLIAFGLTLVYLAWRFEWRFGLAAVLATVHDIIATLAFIKYMNLEVSLFVVGAILTVVGYSMNDKVVVFDRVRENLRHDKKSSLYDLLNRSVNETLPRTVMTGSTTLATLLALLIFGGEVIRPFAWVLIFGIIVGTFSSIYVAAPLLLLIERRWPRRAGEATRKGKPRVAREDLRRTPTKEVKEVKEPARAR